MQTRLAMPTPLTQTTDRQHCWIGVQSLQPWEQVASCCVRSLLLQKTQLRSPLPQSSSL